MTYIETTTLSKTVFRTTVWKCHIDDIFYYGTWVLKPDIEAFIEQATLHHLTIEFTAETYDTETAILDTVVYKGTRFKEKSILMQRHILNKRKASCTHISPRVTLQMLKKEFVKGEALRILQKNSSETTLGENNSNLKKKRLMAWTEATHNLSGAPNVNFRKISVRKTICDLEFSEHLL